MFENEDLETMAEAAIAGQFERAGIEPFPEVSRRKAAQILKCSEGELLAAIRGLKLRARKVGKTDLILIVDLWQFGVERELKKLKKNKPQ